MIKNTSSKVKIDELNNKIMSYIQNVRTARAVDVIKHLYGENFKIGQRTVTLHRLRLLAECDYLDLEKANNKTTVTLGSRPYPVRV
ncbi:hypothetical protein [Methanocella paludicola]|uniref:hypothetical protein n=1 Tax=Methanocella paludicola TaxID=570267 RepID=UPI000FFBC0E0|nr:hypothetical protein [Methanocella paludicola]